MNMVLRIYFIVSRSGKLSKERKKSGTAEDPPSSQVRQRLQQQSATNCSQHTITRRKPQQYVINVVNIFLLLLLK